MYNVYNMYEMNVQMICYDVINFKIKSIYSYIYMSGDYFI